MSNRPLHKAYSAVSLTGGSESIKLAKDTLEELGFRVAHSDYDLLLENVLHSDMEDILSIAAERSLEVLIMGKKELSLKEGTSPKPLRLNLESGKWYWADNLEDSTPLLFVKDIQVSADTQLFTLEYLNPAGLPIPYRIAAQEAIEYGFRPATVEDFERYGLIPPDHRYLATRTADTVTTPQSSNLDKFKSRQSKVVKKYADMSRLKEEISYLEERREILEKEAEELQAMAESENMWYELDDEIDDIYRLVDKLDGMIEEKEAELSEL